ncbi:occlusion-derived virus envelope protein [Anticarsia gemmatalis multiple nucleopolyhedrovirus]|uniref:Occlusion-derived virus envelope protein n=1 Tax=Anticarsia gemmatalis multiple nucleopolyhedrovirus TaxID=268591 RepID=A0A0S3IVV6_9ABAC|nr:occlusion-derived virus envelope protein [Anticarsia gemmatalis multiple nucleopolyhedrovirus]ALR69919.1 occlusion-derived virus envelope protein [Anticarsia gemmatalis multiple nucleopolyhedrovirus]ALR70077.1 occlusion-derived virus envelope protein [Anticarsia gemmatalis multiple nucleopolyhedrovirus]ALR70234.1 occlusion-derived virus envelope protein [Anticarsia gemmatalis multiple nucleopolyhedrovirus]ALR70391.1 occlusion-derived virus envelope protein [Anticarsia gemmatalis multiple nuc
MPITLILVLVVVLFIFLFASTSSNTINNKSYTTNNNEIISYTTGVPVLYGDELISFEQWSKDNMTSIFAKKAEKVANPTRNWNPNTVFDNLSPWTSAADFGTVCHTLIGYAVRYNNAADALYQSPELADNLIGGLRAVCERLPDPPPHQQAPWGPVADWYHFTITMPEVFMTLTIVLNNTWHYEEAATLTQYWLGLYLPTAVTSMGWYRTAGNAMRMGVPYVYSQLLRGYFLKQIAHEPSVQETLHTVAFPFVATGNGLHADSIYIDHVDVRAYGYLINSFFTFDYYTRLFGANAVNTEGLTRAIENVGSPEGVVVPGVMSRNGTLYSNVIGNFIDYPIAVHSADLSKVLTKLSDTYYGAVVGVTTRLAYYEADPTNNTQAPLWTMTRRIWNRRAPIINYNANTLPFESGVILQSLNGILRVPSTTTSTQSFRPAVGNTALVKTRTAGAILINARFSEMNNLQFKSCTLFYDHGMFQLYYNIGVEPNSLNNVNGRVVVLNRDTSVNTNDLSFELQRVNNGGSSEGTVFNGIVCHRVPITNLTVPSLTVRSPNSNVELIEQIISFQNMYTASAVACYKLNVEGYSDALRAFRVNTDEIYVNTGAGVKALFAYPWLMIKEDTTVVFMSALEDTVIPFNVITNAFSAINEPSIMYTPNNCYYLHGNGFKLNNDSISLQFIFDIMQ